MNMRRYLSILSITLCVFAFAGCNRQQPENAAAPGTSAVVGAADDGAVTTKVKAALMAEPDVKSFDIKVETKGGDVTLSGEVDNQAQIDHAVEVARKVEGVKNVTNQLTIKKGAA